MYNKVKPLSSREARISRFLANLANECKVLQCRLDIEHQGEERLFRCFVISFCFVMSVYCFGYLCTETSSRAIQIQSGVVKGGINAAQISRLGNSVFFLFFFIFQFCCTCLLDIGNVCFDKRKYGGS